MKINIKNFKNVITKATMNFGIETLQLRFGDRIKSDMISSNGTSISILNVENNVLDTNDEVEFNFSDLSNQVIPLISLFDNDEVDISFEDIFMKLKDGSQMNRIGFCSESTVRRLGRDGVKDVEWFYEIIIDQELMDKFHKIKKIGSKFGKVYMVVSNNKLFIETSDRTNRYSNGVEFKIDDVNMVDLSLNYMYSDFVNFYNCIEMDMGKRFTLKLSYDNEQELGCIYTYSENEEEKYALISRENL
jgi:hypothetical protein